MRSIDDIDEEIDFLRGMNFRNWAVRIENRIMKLETMKLVYAEKANPEFKCLGDYT